MPTPSTTISSNNIQTEFGGANPIGLSEYYSGGSYVSSNVVGVPSSGTIAMSQLRNKSKVTITANVSSVNEGDSVTFTINSSSLNNTVVYWATYSTVTGVGPTDVVGDSPLGSVTISSNTATVTLTIKLDADTPETGEKFGLRLYYTQADRDAFTNYFAESGEIVNINNATYTATPAASNINEGSNLTINVTTTNITNGTTLYWSINHTTTSSSDFTANSGSFTITSNAGSFTVGPLADQVTDGAETFTVSIRAYSTSGTVLATTSSITVNDTSTTPAPTYSVTPAASDVNEGSSITINVATTNVGSTTLYWTILHGETSSSDFSASSGQVTITNNAGSFSITTVADTTTEGDETFQVQIRTGSIIGTIVATSSYIWINDTSVTPYYTVTSSVGSVNEGGSFTITFNTNVAGTVSQSYTITGVSSADIGNASLTGTFTANGQTRTYTVTADTTTEGTETFTMTVDSSGSTASVTINDTSTAPVGFNLSSITMGTNNTVSAGDEYTITVTATTTRSTATKITVVLNQVYYRGNNNTDWVEGNVTYTDLITIPANSLTGTFTARPGPEQGSRTGTITASAGTGAPTLSPVSASITMTTQVANNNRITGVNVAPNTVTVVPTSSTVSGVINSNICWFQFIANATTSYTIDTNASTNTGSLAIPDTRVAIYRLINGLCIGMNDDIGGGNYRSSVTVSLTQGQTYWVAVGHYSGWAPTANSTTYWGSGAANTTLAGIGQTIKLSIAVGNTTSSPQ